MFVHNLRFTIHLIFSPDSVSLKELDVRTLLLALEDLAGADMAELVGSTSSLSGLPVIAEYTVTDFAPDELAAIGLNRLGNFPFQTAPPDIEWNSGNLNPDTAAGTRQLAWILNDEYKTDYLRLGIPHFGVRGRLPDVEFKFEGELLSYSELKFAADKIKPDEVRRDAILTRMGI